MGYAGGEKKNPTYYRMGDHTETLQVDYDPEQISYQELLEVFWNSHNPTRRSWSRQYKPILFFHNEEQEQLARKTRDLLENQLNRKVHPEIQWAGIPLPLLLPPNQLNRKVHTEIQSLTSFYLAENYHQKYYLQGVPDLNNELRAYYPEFTAFLNSTAAARINGYVGGYGSLASLEEEIDSFALPPSASERLKRNVR